MNILKLTLLACLMSLSAFGQTCSYKKLSKDFNFKISLLPKEDYLMQVKITVSDKWDAKKKQTLSIDTYGIYPDSFNDCKNARSFSTKINSELPTGNENDSGNFIVADFNFDGLEDFAVKIDIGGNGGPLYYYFIQGEDEKFYKSSYLSDIVKFFPIEINQKKKTITTYLHANTYQQHRRIFKYNQKAKKWKLIYSKLE